ncbi:MAG: general stress protein [Pseudonocardiaceae bacterium]
MSTDTDHADHDQIPDAVVAVYGTEVELTAAIKYLEHEKFDMSHISVVGKGLTEERHIVGFETPAKHTAHWAKWGGLWGWLFGAFIFIPGLGHIAVGGYLLFLLASAGVGAVGGAAGGVLTSVGIPKDGIPKYAADLRANRFLVIAHGTPNEVDRARELLAHTNHDRIDHHSSAPQVS